MMMQ
jgi:hypothetical protein